MAKKRGFRDPIANTAGAAEAAKAAAKATVEIGRASCRERG